MLRHIVFWKVKDDEDKEKNMDLIVRMLYSLDGKIKGLESVELGYSLDKSSEYDISLCAGFKSPAALKYYQNHPEHLRCKDFISKVTEKRISFDFIPEDPEFMDFEFPVDFSEQTDKTSAGSSTAYDTQTDSSANYQSLVRPVIPGINAPGDFILPEESENYQNSYIHGIIQKSVKETNEDYDVLESIVDTDEDDPYGTNGYDDNLVVEEEATTDIGSAVPSADTAPQTSDTPAMPAQQPFAPAASATPAQQPFAPAAPAMPAQQPFAPAAPATPVQQPFAPAAPAAPVQQQFTSAAPAASVQQPFAPAAPAMPVQQPFTSAAPTEPVQPAKPRESTSGSSVNIPKSQKKSSSATNPVKPIQETAPVKPSIPDKPAPDMAKPQKKSRFFGVKKVEDESPKADDMTNKWRCPSCGKINADYVGTCGCGASKPFMDFEQPVEPEYNQEENEQNGWKCPRCGLLHSNFITDCSCGYVNNSGINVNPMESTAPMKASDFSKNTDRIANLGTPKPVQTEVTSIDNQTAQAINFRDRNTRTSVASSKPTPNYSDTPKTGSTPTSSAAKADKKSFFGRKKKEEVKEEIDMSKFWTCPNCGKLNNNYVGTCGCGESKPFEFDFDNNSNNESKSTSVPKSNAWKCPKCGRLNNNFVTVCSCGYENVDEGS